MTIDKQNLDNLYKSYGFKVRTTSSEKIKVYTYRSGYFNNADFIPLDGVTDTSLDFDEYQKAGFACTIRNYKTLADAEKELFEGFFALKSTKKRFYDEENKFKKRQTNLIGANYKYITPPYRNVYKEKETNNDIPLTEHLINEIKHSGPRLIILEAAAGYGKTCTSFELLRKTLDSFTTRLPLFIELSRNRQAKIFRYVLLDEIDRVFPSLSVKLVQSQITKGSLFLIVDGFDELLHRTEAASPDYDKVEPMLETLSDLLKNNAKIVLTSRKTAIFSGDHFHTWMENHENDFHISRYSLLKPNIDDWLTYERRSALESAAFPIHKISNPVLLAFLSGQGQEEFDHLVTNVNKIVKFYFTRLLDREKERQELLMGVDEQYELFVRLAAHMLESDFTAEDHEYLQLFILENNGSLLSSVRSRYPSESRPTTDELTAKLVSHALLDRKGEDGDRVGFVNDFALGNFVAEHIITCQSNELIIADDFLEQAVTAFRARSETKRITLWEKLKFTLEFVASENRVTTEISLCGHPINDLTGETFTSSAFENTTFGDKTKIENCVFSDCTFNNISFNLTKMHNIMFAGCRFYECSYEGNVNSFGNEIHIAGCFGEGDIFLNYLGITQDNITNSQLNELDLYKKSVLEQYWPVGRPHFRNKRQLITLYKGHSNEERRFVSKAISNLQHEGILFIKGDTAEINTSKQAKLREILGR